MPLLPRFTNTRRRDEQQIAKILLESGEELPVAKTFFGATLPGDARRLRGIPCVARSVAGAIPGTNPLAALMRSVRDDV